MVISNAVDASAVATNTAESVAVALLMRGGASSGEGVLPFLPPPRPSQKKQHHEPRKTSLLSCAAPLVLTFKGLVGVTVALYILNQSHILPRHISGPVSRVLFWPTLPITVARRIGKWITPIDETVVMGGAPFDFLGIPDRIYRDYGVRGVVNLCQEYKGPLNRYKELGIEELALPTTDHFEPSLDDLKSAVAFIRRYQARGEKVYVHCRAGHGRSAAAVFAWLLSQQPTVNLQDLNLSLGQRRMVRSTLWRQDNMVQFHKQLLEKGTLADAPPDGEVENDEPLDEPTYSAVATSASVDDEL